jgi:hypothetical protein
MVPRLVALFALVSAGCTLDYQGLLEGSGGAGGGAGGGDGGAASGAGAATSTSATTTTSGAAGAGSTSDASATSGGGAGGDGDGGATGAGGGEGGGLPFAEPCPGLAIAWGDDAQTSLSGVWEEDPDNEGSISYDPVTGMTIELDDDEAAGIRTAAEDALDGCSVTISIDAVDPAELEDGAVRIGVGVPGHVLEVVLADDEGGPTCSVRAGSEEVDDVPPIDCADGGPLRRLRIRHTGSQLCYDQGSHEGPLTPMGACVGVGGPRRAAVFASSSTAVEVTIGAVE